VAAALAISFSSNEGIAAPDNKVEFTAYAMRTAV
jgi:hypothetical protein